jgi:dienelactone hydrolase
VVLGALVALGVAAAPARAAFDAGYEARNFSKTTERATRLTLLPDYQVQLRMIGVDNTLRAVQILAADGPPTGRTFLGQLCWEHIDACSGDTRLYDFGDKHYGKVTPVLFTARNGSTLSGHVWATVAGPPKRPGVVITNGSVQAPEELYWFAAQTLAKAGYVVMTWDPQGQGYSDTIGEGADTLDGVPSQGGQPFYDGTEDALDFFFSGPGAPYVPRRSCSTGTDHATKQGRRVVLGLNSAYNPMADIVDLGRVGLVGHSLGAAAVSYIGQIDPRVKAIVAYDNLAAPAKAPFGCKSGSGPRPVPVLTKPALGLSADYGLLPIPNLSTPDPLAKSGASLALSRAGVDTGELVIRGGTHFEFSFIPNLAFGATLRGEDLVSWYTTAWLDKYVKGEGASADARLLTDRWRADELSGAIDPDKDPNMYSRYYRSRLDLHTAGGDHVVCEDARGCGSLRPDSDKVPYSFLEAIRRVDAVPVPGTPASLIGEASLAPAGSLGTPVGASGAGGALTVPQPCRDSAAPASRITRLGSRVTRRGITLRGTAHDAGCDEVPGALVRVAVAVARVEGTRCRMLQPGGRLSAPRACSRLAYLPARGTSKWTFSRRLALPTGSYRIAVRGVDAAGNTERPQAGRATLTLRVR